MSCELKQVNTKRIVEWNMGVWNKAWQFLVTGIFWSTSYVEFEGNEGAQEYFSQVGTQNLVNKGALEYFGRLVT